MRNCLLLSGTITASIPFFSESKHPPHPHFPAIWDQAPVLPTTSPAEGLFCTTNPPAHLSPVQNVTDIPGKQREIGKKSLLLSKLIWFLMFLLQPREDARQCCFLLTGHPPACLRTKTKHKQSRYGLVPGKPVPTDCFPP